MRKRLPIFVIIPTLLFFIYLSYLTLSSPSPTGFATYVINKENIEEAINKLFEESFKKEKLSIVLSIKDKNCYWLKQAENKTNFFLQINIIEDSKCLGAVKEKKFISSNFPFNYYGKSCFCGPSDYLISVKSGKIGELRVEEFHKPSVFEWIELSVSQFFQRIIKWLFG